MVDNKHRYFDKLIEMLGFVYRGYCGPCGTVGIFGRMCLLKGDTVEMCGIHSSK